MQNVFWHQPVHIGAAETNVKLMFQERHRADKRQRRRHRPPHRGHARRRQRGQGLGILNLT